MRKSYEVVSKVTLTPKNENATLEFEQEYATSYDGYDSKPVYTVIRVETADWDLVVEAEKSQKYKTAVQFVGEARAAELLKALGL